MGKGGNEKSTFACVGCIGCVGVLLMLILLPMSFHRVQYFEAGLVQQRSTGSINKEKVYGPGLYCIGPDFEFKKFPTSLNFYNQRLSVWSKAGTDDAGSTLIIDVSFQYKINSKDIGKLYTKVARNYQPLVNTYATDAIKNSAPSFGVDDFLTKRSVIESAFLVAVKTAVEAPMYVKVTDLQLRQIGLTSEYTATKLNAALQVQKNEKEKYLQQKTLIEENTSLDVLKVQNVAKQARNAAIANAKVIKEKAKYESKKLTEEARNNGLKYMLGELGLTTEEHKASLDYITTLINNKAGVKPYVNLASSGLLQKQVN